LKQNDAEPGSQPGLREKPRRPVTSTLTSIGRAPMFRTFISVIFVTLVTTGTSIADATCDEAAKQFSEAIKVYVKDGNTAFMERLLKNGPLEGDKRALSQVQGLGQIEQFFGAIQSSSVVSKKSLGPKVCYLIGILEYANGPAFAVATYYKGSKGVGATSMFFKTEPEAVFPNELLVEK
jgi:hypothetical protein